MTCCNNISAAFSGLTIALALTGLPAIASADSPAPSETTPTAEAQETATDQDVYPLPDIYEPPQVTIDDLRPALIEQIQRVLKRHGYALGRADGIVGPMTRLALNDFLAAHGWPTGYELNDRVLRALGIAPDHLGR